MVISDTSVGFLIFTINIVLYSLLCFQCYKKTSELLFDSNDNSLWVDNEKIISFRKGSRNLKLIELLYQNIDREVEISQIEKEVFFDGKINLSKVIRNTGIPSQIIKSHFVVTKNGITLKKEGDTN